MLDTNDLIKVEILTWMSENKWLNQNPAHDYSIEYFYNFFEKKVEGLTRLHLDELLCDLADAGLVELKLYWNTRESKNRVDVIRGLTIDGRIWVNLSRYKSLGKPDRPFRSKY